MLAADTAVCFQKSVYQGKGYFLAEAPDGGISLFQAAVSKQLANKKTAATESSTGSLGTESKPTFK